jgi:transposase
VDPSRTSQINAIIARARENGCVEIRARFSPDASCRPLAKAIVVVARASRIQQLGKRRRRRWSAKDKAAIVQETYAPGASVSLVARQHGIAPSQLFRWRRHYTEAASAVAVEGDPVPASELRALRHQVRELQRLLGKLTLENENLREALERALRNRRA